MKKIIIKNIKQLDKFFEEMSDPLYNGFYIEISDINIRMVRKK